MPTVWAFTPVFHQHTSLNLLADGLQIFTYAAGTSTKLSTYTDSTGTSANTNPKVLNTRGEMNLWLDVTKLYKILLCSAAEPDPPVTNIWSVDFFGFPQDLPALKIDGNNVVGYQWTGYEIGDQSAVITTGTAKKTWRLPACTVLAVRFSLTTASSSGVVTVDINESGTSILSTKLTTDANELTSTTAATAAVISDSTIADDAQMTVDYDTAGTGAVGGKLYIKVAWT
jgi:hypothetical protein